MTVPYRCSSHTLLASFSNICVHTDSRWRSLKTIQWSLTRENIFHCYMCIFGKGKEPNITRDRFWQMILKQRAYFSACFSDKRMIKPIHILVSYSTLSSGMAWDIPTDEWDISWYTTRKRCITLIFTYCLVSLKSTSLFPVPHEEMYMVPLHMAYQKQNACRHQK